MIVRADAKERARRTKAWRVPNQDLRENGNPCAGLEGVRERRA